MRLCVAGRIQQVEKPKREHNKSILLWPKIEAGILHKLGPEQIVAATGAFCEGIEIASTAMINDRSPTGHLPDNLIVLNAKWLNVLYFVTPKRRRFFSEERARGY